MGVEQERIGQLAAALRSFQEAVLILEIQIRGNPSDPPPQRNRTGGRKGTPILVQLQVNLASAYRGLGIAQQSSGRRALALRSLEKAVTIRRALVRDDPAPIDFLVHLASNLSALGLLLDEMGQSAAALSCHQEALAIFDTRLRHASKDTGLQAERADTINWIAALEHKMGRIADSIRSHEQAREVIQKLVRDEPQVRRYKQALCIGDKGLGGLYRKVGRWNEALALLDEAQAIMEPFEQTWPTYYYHLACCLALRIPPDSESPSPLAAVDGRRNGDRAMTALRRAATRANKSFNDYRTDPNLDPLRDRDDFRALLMDLALPADPFAP